MKIILTLLLLLSIVLSVSAQDSVQIIRLKHRQAEELIPTIEGLFSGQVQVKTMNNRLFVRSSPQIFAEVQKLVSELDRKPKMLRISVNTDGKAAARNRGFQAGGRVDTRGVVHPRIDVQDSEQRGQGLANRVVQALEGSPAVIHANGGGFTVIAQLQGKDGVYLKVSQLEQGQSNTHQSSSTSISGRLGEWIEIGGVTQSMTGKNSGILSRQSSGASSQSKILIRVDANH